MRSDTDGAYVYINGSDIGSVNSKRRNSMVSLATASNTKEKSDKSKFNDEFENYLKRQCLTTTFNGFEIETFSWYKKVLGLL